MSTTPKQTAEPKGGTAAQSGTDGCSTPIDANAPAGSPGSLGSKSDCNGRPTTDDSVVEAMDEMGPALTPPERDVRR